jgi:hypothetical protein
MQASPLRNLRIFQSLCGDVLSNVVLTTTHWDVVDQTLALEREAELWNMYWKGIMERAAKVKWCDESRDAAWKLVDSLLSVDRNVLIFRHIQQGNQCQIRMWEGCQ